MQISFALPAAVVVAVALVVVGVASAALLSHKDVVTTFTFVVVAGGIYMLSGRTGHTSVAKQRCLNM